METPLPLRPIHSKICWVETPTQPSRIDFYGDKSQSDILSLLLLLDVVISERNKTQKTVRRTWTIYKEMIEDRHWACRLVPFESATIQHNAAVIS